MVTDHMTSVPLYAIADQYVGIIDRLIDGGGEITPELQGELDAITDAFEGKVERVALYTRNLIGLAEAAEAEAKRLTELAGVRKRSADGLKGYLMEQLQRVNQTKVVTPLAVVRIQKNSRPSIQWFGPPQLIPEPYRRVTITVDGTAAYEGWKRDGMLPDGFVIETGEHLRIS